MIRSIVTFVPPHSKRSEIRTSLKSLVEPIRVQPGCLTCYLPHCADKKIRIICEWDSYESLEEFISSRLNSRLLSLVELSNEEPELSFEKITETFGLERFAPSRE